MPESPLSIGPIGAAVLAGVFAFIATVLSKEQKTSEFRQAWIDAVRNDLSDYLAVSIVMHDSIAVRERQGESQQERTHFIFEHRADFVQMEAFAAKIKLRLNPNEHKKLIDLIDLIADLTNDAGDDKYKKSDEVAGQIIAESQAILKSEWRRVKRGEPIFQVTKWTSMVLAVIAVIYLCFSLVGM